MDTLLAALHDLVKWFTTNTQVLWIFGFTATLVAVEVLFGTKDQPAWKSRLFNLLYVITLLAVYVFLYPAIALISNRVAGFFGGPLFDLTTNSKGEIALMFIGLFVYAFVFDFFYYWHHRTQHKSSVLWETHKLHHADESLNVTTTFKHHWSDDIVRILTMYIPMGILFKFEPITIWWMNYILTIHGMLVHMNINWHWGWFTNVLTGPNFHRIHHSFKDEHIDRNFAFYFPILDIVFKTHYFPKKNEFPATGLDTGERIYGLWNSHFYPFKSLFARFSRWQAKARSK